MVGTEYDPAPARRARGAISTYMYLTDMLVRLDMLAATDMLQL